MAGPRNVLITGATSGIGLALATRLAPRHRLLVTGTRMSDELNALADKSPDLRFLKLDQRKPETAAAALKSAIRKRGWHHLDNAVLNAGIGQMLDPSREPAQSIRDTLAVNLTSNIAIAHMLFPLLETRQGKLTLIGSTAHRGSSRFSSYAASKAGLHAFFRSLREEWRGRVDVQILHLGPTRTAMHNKAGYDPGLLRLLFVSPQDMAAMMEKAIARGRPVQNLTLFRFYNGSSILGRGL
jgi:NAD(P)-dependent dehydrogenase (short-subunit alcohol dehydrogenase family)